MKYWHYKLHNSKSAISIWETDKKVRYKHFIFKWIWLNVYLQKCTDIAEKWDKVSISIQDIQISGLRAITTFPKKALHKEINFLWNCSTSGIQIHSSSSLWRKSNQSSDLEFLIQDSSQRGIYFYDVGGAVRSPFFIWKKEGLYKSSLSSNTFHSIIWWLNSFLVVFMRQHIIQHYGCIGLCGCRNFSLKVIAAQ